MTPWMFRVTVAIAVAASACSYDARDGAVWTGAVVRDGTSVEFVGYDPYPAQGQGFGASPMALGYIEVDDDTLLVKIWLELVRVDRYVATMAPQLVIKDTFLTAEFGMGLSYVEQRASDLDATETEQPYRQVYLEGHGGTTTGTFDVTGTNFSDVLDGQLDAVLDSPTYGRRELHMTVHWNGAK